MTKIMIIILISVGLPILVGAYYYLIKPALKLRKLRKEQEKQELKKKNRRKSWQKTHISPDAYMYRKK